MKLINRGYWLPGPPPIVKDVSTLTLNSREKLNNEQTRLNFTITGSVLTSLMFRTKPEVTLSSWNILSTIPEPNEYNNEKNYFVMITYGSKGDSMNVILDLKGEKKDNEPLIDVTIVTIHWEYFKEHTPPFAQLLARVPPWAFAVSSVAELHAKTF